MLEDALHIYAKYRLQENRSLNEVSRLQCRYLIDTELCEDTLN